MLAGSSLAKGSPEMGLIEQMFVLHYIIIGEIAFTTPV